MPVIQFVHHEEIKPVDAMRDLLDSRGIEPLFDLHGSRSQE